MHYAVTTVRIIGGRVSDRIRDIVRPSKATDSVTYRKVLLFWLPLALSWLLMTFESLWIQGVIGRKPDAETQLAAFGLMFSLSVLIETPVIMLLATSNALSRDRQSFRTLWRFMMGCQYCRHGRSRF